MKEWLTTSELAGLPGLPVSRDKLLAKAKRENWRTRQREEGKGFEFHIASLPVTTRTEIEKHAAISSTEQASRKRRIRETVDAAAKARNQEQGLKDYMALPEKAKERVDAKVAILDLLNKYTNEHQLGKVNGLSHFCTDWNRKALAVDQTLQAQFPTLTQPTLYRWQKTLAEQGLAPLAGNYNKRESLSLIESQQPLKDFVLAMIVDYPHTSVANLMAACEARFKGSDIKLPSARRMQAWTNQWKQDNRQLLMAVTNPDGWKNKFMTAFGDASEGIERINQKWETDSTPADVMLLDGRHSLIGVIDVFTRRPMLLVSKTSKSSAICLLLRRALIDWGVPEVIKTDNGSDYTSNQLVRVYRSLGIEHDQCEPFSGWQKPHIERFFRTFSHSIVELLPGYIGHNVADRKAIESRKAFSDRLFKKDEIIDISMTSGELQAHCDRWIQHVYMHDHHDGLDQTPFEALAAARTPVRAISDERALDVLLAEAPGDGLRTIGKKGITIDGINFVAPELGMLVGERVHVRFSEQLGYVYVFNADGFVCVAEAPEFTGISRKEVAAHAREKQKQNMQDARRELKATARRVNSKNAAEEILASREQETSNLLAMPQRRIEHSTDEIAAAIQATNQMPGLTADIVPLTMDKPIKAFNDPRENHAAWLRVEMRITQGFLVSQDDRDGLAIYKNSEDYQSMQEMFHSFGLKAEDF